MTNNYNRKSNKNKGKKHKVCRICGEKFMGVPDGEDVCDHDQCRYIAGLDYDPRN